MSKTTTQRIAFSPGEEVLLCSVGHLTLELASGVLEVAGQFLEANQAYRFFLNERIEGAGDSGSALVCYSFDGGVLNVKSEHPLRVFRGATTVSELRDLVYRPLLHPMDPFRILVLGRPGVGKTHAAHTLCNLFHRAQQEMGSTRRTFLADLNPSSNVLYAPGCVTSREVTRTLLRLGQTAEPEQTPLSISFYCGTTHRPSTQEESFSILHFAEQCVETTTAWIEEQQQLHAPSSSSTRAGWPYALVMDATSPSGEVKALHFFKQLIQLVRPTHVVLVTDEVKPGFRFEDDNAEDEEESEAEAQEPVVETSAAPSSSSLSFTPRWAQLLMEDVRRTHPDCHFIRTPPVLQQSLENPALSRMVCREVAGRLLQRYFVGSPSSFSIPLGCCKVVLPSSALQFVELQMQPDWTLTAHPAEAPQCTWGRLLCALSHAEIMEEVPLAPTAGLLLITHVDEESDEMVLLVPASSTEPLRRRFAILPSYCRKEGNPEGASWDRDLGLRLSAAHLTGMEESSVV